MKTFLRYEITAEFEGERYVTHESEWKIGPVEAVATPEMRKQFRAAVSRDVFGEGVNACDDGKTVTEENQAGEVRRVPGKVTEF